MSSPDVSLVIPGRNAGATLRACLDAVCPFLARGELREIVFVDDGSTDDTRSIAEEYPVRIVTGTGEGPGAARNRGISAADGKWIWFIDSDCVAEPDALSILLKHTHDPNVAAAGGSYGNMRPDSLLACIIHEEIIARHDRMSSDVDFLATFNVLYRHDVLNEVGGFDERFLKAQDAELAYRVRARGYALRFDARSRVRHFHPTRLRSYLATQRDQGYWRMFLYRAYPDRMSGDSYSGLTDYAQPPLALAILALLPFSPISSMLRASLIATVILLLACQLPMARTLAPRLGLGRAAAFTFMSTLRAFARALGMARGALAARTANRASAAGPAA
jgi:glycosyltransferase involved in cell wall biosynthesis